MPEPSLLEHILSTRFCQGVSFSYEELSRWICDPAFPARARAFKTELADTILRSTLTPEAFERLTALDQESQADVDRFLVTELWEPLFGEEPVRIPTGDDGSN